jgi:hypothetical protein
MRFAVSFEIIIQRAVGNESCYPMKNTLINYCTYSYYPIGVEKQFFTHLHTLSSFNSKIYTLFFTFSPSKLSKQI